MTLPAIGCVTDGVFSARHDTQPSNAGNVPLNETKKTWQGQGRFGRRITRLVGRCITPHSSLPARSS
jgi:DNA-binding protein H-NS